MSGAPSGRNLAARTAVFAALVVLCAGVGVAYVVHARSGNPRLGNATQPTLPPSPDSLAAIMHGPHILFRNTDLGPNYARVAVVPLADPSGPRSVTPLTCDRVAMADGMGVCGTTTLAAYASYDAKVFDAQFSVRQSVPLLGPPNRIRVSPDGRWASVTVFVRGDSYADANFSTRATFIDTTGGRDLGNLEQFRVTEDGHRVRAINRNYWGVTFTDDSDRFYATQAVGDDIRLIEGRRSAGDAHTLARRIECPAISPDQTRVAYKLRSGKGLGKVRWRLHVLDLSTGEDHALAETRNIDDQVEWLDDGSVLYTIPRPDSGAVTDVWSVPADGSGVPRILIRGASSPSVDRDT